MGRMIVWFSCGAASAVAAKIAVNEYADSFDVEVCYCNTLADEHPDNVRFMQDVEKWIGQPIKILRSEKYDNIYDVFRGECFIVGPYGAPCTRILKKQVRLDYQLPGDVHVIGFTADEVDRKRKLEENAPDLDCEWVLIDRGINKTDCHLGLESAGIKRPVMYELGFKHNNCMGCVKGGMGHWNLVRKHWPERFETMSRIEREIGATVIRVNGMPLYLDDLDPLRGDGDDVDFDCGVFCDFRRAEVAAMLSSTATKGGG